MDLLVAELGIGPGCRVLDLAAGTGIFTALLAARGAEVVAVEPVAGMIGEFRRSLPAVEVLEGAAEAIPLPDASVDVVTVAQAFHWFDAPAALAEIHRVLRPRGGLALVWNVRDRREPWVAALARYLEHETGPLPYEHEGLDWGATVAGHGGFSPLQRARFPYAQDADVDTIVKRAASTSFVSALPDPERAAVLDHVRSLVSNHPDLAGRARFPFPHQTNVYWCRRTT